MSSLIDEIETVIEPQVRPFCGPLFFARSLGSALGNVTANGSFGLVDTGQKKLLVTCHHVWDEFEKSREHDSGLRMFVCLDRNPPVCLDSAPVGLDRSLDIATFDIEPLLGACEGRKFFPLREVRACPLNPADRLFFFGYPGYLRSVSGEGIQFGRFSYAVSVSGVSGLRFIADVSHAKRIYAPQFEGIETTNPHGGISGSPCFLVRDDRTVQLV